MSNDKKKKKRKPPREKEIEKILLTYGRYSKSMDSLRHYDSLQSLSEEKVSNANWYAVAAAGFLFSITKDSFLTSVICMAIGLTDILYLSACYVTSLVTIEKFYISFFYELIKSEEDEKWIPPIYHYMFIKEETKQKGRKAKQEIFHHGSSYLKSIYYIINLSVPFVVLIFTPAYIILRKAELDIQFNKILQSWLGKNLGMEFPLLLYIAICLLIFVAYAFFLFKLAGPMQNLLKTLYKMSKKNVE